MKAKDQSRDFPADGPSSSLASIRWIGIERQPDVELVTHEGGGTKVPPAEVCWPALTGNVKLLRAGFFEEGLGRFSRCNWSL